MSSVQDDSCVDDAVAAIIARAEAAELDGKPLLAIEYYEQALSDDPENTTAAINLSMLLKYRGQTTAARDRMLQALTADVRLRSSASRLLDGGRLFGLADVAEDELADASDVLRRVLHSATYGSQAVSSRLGCRLFTGHDLLVLREDAVLCESLRKDAQGCALLLFALGAALPREEVARLLGAAAASELLHHGLLLDCDTPWDLVASPVQIYPLSVFGDDDEREDVTGSAHDEPAASPDLLLATDFDCETLLPTKWAIMPIGYDSLNLVRLAPHLCRASVGTLLDLCCGSGVQGLLALANEMADRVLAVDINPRALRFTRFNAMLNGPGFASRLTTCTADVYSGVPESWRPFDVIFANPPFVATPRLDSLPHADGASVHAEWALYADGGPDGADVLRAIVHGAREGGWLRDGGCLAIVTEFPNIRQAPIWLLPEPPATATMSFAVIFNPRHAQSAAEYAHERASERGWPWAASDVWEASLRAHHVDHMSSGLMLAVQGPREIAAGEGSNEAQTLRTQWQSTARCVPLDGGPGSGDLALLQTAEAGIRAVCDELLQEVRQVL